MILVYIDESGVTSLKDTNPIFMLSAVLIEEADLIVLESEMGLFRKNTCKKYNLPNKNFEIHMSQIFKRQGKKVFGRKLDHNELHQIFNEIYQTIIPYNKFKVISIVILKDKLPSGSTKKNVLDWSLIPLLERIEYCLSNEYHSKATIFMDNSDRNKNAEIKKNFKGIIINGTYYKKNFEYIPSYIHFLNSDSNDGIQLCDAISYSIKRFIDIEIYKKTPGVIGNMNNTIFKDLVLPKIRNFPQVLGFGLKIYPSVKIRLF